MTGYVDKESNMGYGGMGAGLGAPNEFIKRICNANWGGMLTSSEFS